MKLPSKAPVVLAVSMAITSATATAGSSRTLVSISAETAAGMVQQRLDHDEFVLVDIRTPGEFAAARIDGAINIDYYSPTFVEQLAEMDRGKTYLIYCRVGNRTGRTMPILERLGFRSVYNMQGGIADWYRRGHPVVTPSQP